MNDLQDRKLLCCLKIHSPPQHDWYNVSFVEHTRVDNGRMGFLEHNKMRNCWEFLEGVNGIHLKGWNENECFELLNILLKVDSGRQGKETQDAFTMNLSKLLQQMNLLQRIMLTMTNLMLQRKLMR
jgi:hypothetical protein